MTDQDKNQLAAAIFGDEELTQLRQTSLQRGLHAMRRRRQRALAARVSIMVLPALLLAAMVLYPRFQPRPPAPAPKAMALASQASSQVEYITAEQLFALYPKRPMALVGKPGHQKLFFLGTQHSATENATSQ